MNLKSWFCVSEKNADISDKNTTREGVELKNFTLRDNQVQSISQYNQATGEGFKRVIIQSQAGSGKSLICAELIKQFRDEDLSVIVYINRRALVTQMAEEMWSFGVDCEISMAQYDWVDDGNSTLIASIDTISSRIKAGKIELPKRDIVIVDEAHIMATEECVSILGQYDRVVGLTATPSAPRLGLIYEKILMGVPSYDLVNEGILVDLDYYSVKTGFENSLIASKCGTDYTESSLEKAYSQDVVMGEVYKHWEKYAKGKSTVVFAVNRKHAKALKAQWQDNGWKCEYVDCETKGIERKLAFSRMQSGESTVLFNTAILTQGIDIKRLECVVFAAQMKSIPHYLQKAGRVIRCFEGKKRGIMIYHGNNLEELGDVHMERDWSLDVEPVEKREEADRDVKEETEDNEIHICGKCDTEHLGLKCPICGSSRRDNGKFIDETSDILVKIDEFSKNRTITSKEYCLQDKIRCMNELIDGYDGSFTKAKSAYKYIFKEDCLDTSWYSQSDCSVHVMKMIKHIKIKSYYDRKLKRKRK